MHLINYCKSIRPHVDEIILVTETPLFADSNKQYIVSFRISNPFTWFNSYFKLLKIISREKPDVIHSHELNRLAFFVAICSYLTKIPYISTAWGSDVLLMPGKNLFYKYALRVVLRSSRYVTADAHAMIHSMKKIFPSNSKYVYQQYGIDPVSKFGDKQNIVFSNRLLQPLYNISKVVNYFAEFVAVYPEWHLNIGATGSQLEHLKAQVGELGIHDKVSFLGWLNKEDNNLNYGITKIFISIPSSDGTSISLLEAMSANCIPVVADLPVSHEWITDGENGVIEKPGKNPLFEALEIDTKQCFEMNQSKIKSSALRSVSALAFFELYKKTVESRRRWRALFLGK